MSGWVHMMLHPEIEILYFLGRLENSGLLVRWASTARSSGVASRIASGSIPATGQPTTFRAISPQAPLEVIPTDSRRLKISGNCSIRSQ
ncbi:hypothetical protein EBS57_06090 [bacterium]|nr:hypothetical protein [bacterium]